MINYYPQLAIIVIPFTAMVGLSRVVLGLHYPSDVLAGALLGGTIAGLSFQIM
jgi:undecaprenyl-diphosphatase